MSTSWQNSDSYTLFGGIIVFVITGLVIKKMSEFRNFKTENIHKRRTMIILGSGGHTTEMFKLIDALNIEIYRPRIYVVAEGDSNSLDRLQSSSIKDEDKIVKTIGRSRTVGQSYVTSIFSTIVALLQSVPLIYQSKPDLILCNGPGTCVPICIVTWFYIKFGVLGSKRKPKMIYVESVCRVKTLSLSAKILSHFVDQVLVQWPELAEKYPNTKFIARFS